MNSRIAAEIDDVTKKIKDLEVLQHLLEEYAKALKEASPDEEELLAKIQNLLDHMDREREAGPQFAEEFQFHWEQFLKLLKGVTSEHRAVVLYLKTILARHVGQEPFEVHFNTAAHLMHLSLGKPVSTFYCEGTLVPASDWILAGLPDPGYFLVRVHGVFTVYHKYFQ